MEIYAYGNVDGLRTVLNALAMIFGAADFQGVVRVVVVLGFLFAGIAAITQQWRGWSWLASMTVVSLIAFVPRTDVTITDKLGVQAPTQVANVPWVLGLMVSVKSQIGHTLTNLFETAFQTIPDPNLALPAQLSYQNHGVMFGARLIREARYANVDDAVLKADLINFMRDCTFPLLTRRVIDPTAFAKTDDMWAMMGTTNQALFTAFHRSGTLVVDTCPNAYNDIGPRLTAASAGLLDRLAAAVATTYPTQPIATKSTQTAEALVAAVNRATIGGAAADASRYLLQNAVINAFADTTRTVAITSGNSAALLAGMAQANATAAANMGAYVEASMAEQAAPMLRNIIEMVVIGLFPVVLLLLLASEGKVLATIAKGYIFALLWVELWPVVYAVLNMIATNQAMNDIAGAAYTGAGTGLSLANAGGIYDAALSATAVTGRMVVYVPLIAAAVLYGFDKIVGIATQRDLGTQSAATASSAAASGNVSAGNVSLEQLNLAPLTRDAFMTHVANYFGAYTRQVGQEGAGFFTANLSSGPYSIREASKIEQQAGERYERSTQIAAESSRARENVIDTAFQLARETAKGITFTDSRGQKVSVDDVTASGVTKSDVDRVGREFAKRLGIDYTSDVQKALSAQLGVGAGGQADANLGNLPLGKGASPTDRAAAALTGARALLKVLPGVNATGSTSEAERIASALSQAQKSLHEIGLDRKQELTQRFATGDEFATARQRSSSAAERVQGSLREADSYATREAQALRDARTAAETQAKLRAFSREIDNKAVNEGFMRWLQHQPGYQPWKMYETPWMSQKLVEYAQTGVLVPDPGRPDAPPAWAPNYGMGPQFEPQKTPEQLQAEYRNQPSPGGGSTLVQAQAAVNAGKVTTAEKRFGVDPNATVSGTDLQRRAAAARNDAQGAVAQRGQEAKTAGDKAAREAQGRMEKVSDKHTPLTGSGTNKAQESIYTDFGRITPDGRPNDSLGPSMRRPSGTNQEWERKDSPPVEPTTTYIGNDKDGVPIVVPKEKK